MGYYIETDEIKGKAQWLIAHAAAEVLAKPVLCTGTHATVCVVDNGPFEAAAIAYSQKEFEVFCKPDGRPKVWLRVPAKHVVRLCPDIRNMLGNIGPPEDPLINLEF